jgi:predicted nuclease with TOPRIM domain
MNLANRIELRNKIIDTLSNQKCCIEADERDENYNYGIDTCISYIEEIFKNCEVEEKLQQEYDELYEAHEALSYDWAKLKKENKELRDDYDDLRKNYNELVIKFNNLYSELHEEGYIEDD